MRVFILFALFAGSHCLPTKDALIFGDDDLFAPKIHLKKETDRLFVDYHCDDGKEVTITAKFWFPSDFEGGQANADAIVEKFVATTNEALTNSKIPTKYQKWGSVQQHPKTNDELRRPDGSSTASNKIFIDSLGSELDDYQYLKQTADHIVILYNTLGSEPNRCSGLSHNGEWWGETFWTIIVTGTMDNALVFAHEAGHCMGAMHNIEQSVYDPDDFNYGYCIPGTSYATVMAYTYTCPEGSETTRIPYYSNPNVEYEGHATGSVNANNALQMTNQKYGYATAGSNCADGTATDKTSVTNQCAWDGDGWNEQPASQCCCEWNLYEGWEKSVSSPSCFLDIPSYGNWWVGQNKKAIAKFKDCKNLLGELINPYETCALGDAAKASSDWRELTYVDCECDAGCVIELPDVNGGWTDWGECDDGTQTRTCTNPRKSGNGADCEGDTSQSCTVGGETCQMEEVYLTGCQLVGSAGAGYVEGWEACGKKCTDNNDCLAWSYSTGFCSGAKCWCKGYDERCGSTIHKWNGNPSKNTGKISGYSGCPKA